MRHAMLAAAGLGLAVLAAPTGAGAQYRSSTDYGYGYDYAPVEAGPYQGRYARVCQPWCPYDYSPCDPPSFKIADRRCRQGDSTR